MVAVCTAWLRLPVGAPPLHAATAKTPLQQARFFCCRTGSTTPLGPAGVWDTLFAAACSAVCSLSVGCVERLGRAPGCRNVLQKRCSPVTPVHVSCTVANCASCLQPNLSAPPCIMQRRVHAVAVCWNKGMHGGSCGRRHGGRDLSAGLYFGCAFGCFVSGGDDRPRAPRRRSACTGSVGLWVWCCE